MIYLISDCLIVDCLIIDDLNQGKMEMKEASQSQPQSQSRHEITQDFKDMKSFLESCECGEEEEQILKKQRITFKLLPEFSESELLEMGIARGPAKQINKALMKYRLNPHHSNENQVCAHFVDRTGFIAMIELIVFIVEFESGNDGYQQTFIIFFFFINKLSTNSFTTTNPQPPKSIKKHKKTKKRKKRNQKTN